MKYHYLFSLIFLLSATLSAYAQKNDTAPELPSNVKFAWGELQEGNAESPLLRTIGSDERGVYMLKYHAGYTYYDYFKVKGYELELYNQQMALSGTTLIGNKDSENNILQQVILSMETIVVFSSSYDEERKFHKLFMHTIDRKSLRVNDDLRQIAEVPFEKDKYHLEVPLEKDKYYYRTSYPWQLFSFAISSDYSKILVAFDEGYHKDQPGRLSLHVFDASMKPIWNKNITLPYPEDKVVVRSYAVDEHNNVYISGKLYDSTRKRDRKTYAINYDYGNHDYKYVLIACTNAGTSVKEYTIDFDKFIVDMGCDIDKHGNVVCSGLYSEATPEMSNFVRGCFSMTVDVQNKKILKQDSRAFADAIGEMMTKKQIREANSGLFSFNLSRLVRRSDGGHILIAEQRTLEANDFQTEALRNTYTYYCDDLAVIHTSAEGKIESITRIPKSYIATASYLPPPIGQSYVANVPYMTLAQEDYGLYRVMVFKDKLYLIFHDHPHNVQELNPERTYPLLGSSIKSGVVALVTVDAQGKTTRAILANTKDSEVIMNPLMTCKFADNKMMLYGRDKRRTKVRFGTMELE